MYIAQDIEDQDLIQGSIKGDRKAQSLLFNKYKRVFFSLAYKTLGPGFEIEDVVQQIFIQIFQALPTFKGNSAFNTWAYRIGINVCTAQLRSKLKKRQPTLVPEFKGIENRPEDANKGPQAKLEQEEITNNIYHALEKVNLKKKMVVILHDMEGKSLDEIAAITGIPVGTVKSRLFHGREEMKKLLLKYLNR